MALEMTRPAKGNLSGVRVQPSPRPQALRLPPDPAKYSRTRRLKAPDGTNSVAAKTAIWYKEL